MRTITASHSGTPLNIQQAGQLDDGNFVTGELLGAGQRGFTSNYGVGIEKDNWRARANARPVKVTRTRLY